MKWFGNRFDQKAETFVTLVLDKYINSVFMYLTKIGMSL